MLRLRLAALLVFVVWSWLPAAPSALLLIAALMALSSFTRYGHALTDPAWLKAGLLMLHLAIVSWWFAFVIALLKLLGQHTSEALTLAHRFARQAGFVIAAALLAGVCFALLQNGPLPWKLESHYVQGLLLKLAGVLLIGCLAVVNRFYLVPAVSPASPHAAKVVKRVLWLDCGLFLTVIMLSAWITGPAAAMG